MRFTLAYKHYDIKMSLAAMRDFDQATGLCLWGKTLEIVSTYIAHRKSDQYKLLIELGRVMSFKRASHYFHALAKQANSKITLEEIQDAMFHSPPTLTDDPLFEPWQIQLAAVAAEIQSYLAEKAFDEKKQKADS